jgi:hypothetical protein
MYLNPVLVFEVINNFKKVFNSLYKVSKLWILILIFAGMTAKNFEQLSAKAQFRVLIGMFMEIHQAKPVDIYTYTKHH